MLQPFYILGGAGPKFEGTQSGRFEIERRIFMRLILLTVLLLFSVGAGAQAVQAPTAAPAASTCTIKMSPRGSPFLEFAMIVRNGEDFVTVSLPAQRRDKRTAYQELLTRAITRCTELQISGVCECTGAQF